MMTRDLVVLNGRGLDVWNVGKVPLLTVDIDQFQYGSSILLLLVELVVELVACLQLKSSYSGRRSPVTQGLKEAVPLAQVVLRLGIERSDLFLTRLDPKAGKPFVPVELLVQDD
jgi:hypothetical protein